MTPITLTDEDGMMKYVYLGIGAVTFLISSSYLWSVIRDYSDYQVEISIDTTFYVDGYKISRFITPSGDICYVGSDKLSCIPVE
jgi:hypothetical protein